MAVKPGDAVYASFGVQSPTTGGASDADSLPTAVLRHDGVNDGGVTVTVTHNGTGDYTAQATIPTSGYLAGDTVEIIATATVGGITGKGTVFGAVVDTLRASDEPAAVWNNGARTLTAVASPPTTGVQGADILAQRGDSFSWSPTGLGSLAGRTALYYTIKRNPVLDADSAAVVQIREVGGLLTLNGAPAPDATQGTLVVNDATLGNITVTLSAAVMAALGGGLKATYDVEKVVISTVTTLAQGQFHVSADVTRAVT